MRDADLGWLYSLSLSRIEPGLDRITVALERLGDPQRRVPVIHVTGTNGKGSTAAMLSSILRASGRRVGVYSSPHLVEFNERVAIDGEPVDDETLRDALDRVAALEADLTFFEFTTAAAFLIFAGSGIDVIVVETGMGGSFDATNVVESELSIITNVGLDHVRFLGSTVEEIAADKAGVMRAQRVCLTGASGSALSVLEREAHERRAVLERVPRPENVRVSWSGTSWDGYSTPLIGAYQAHNAMLAARAARRYGVDDETIRHGLRDARIRGRFDVFGDAPRTIVDAAHNAEGMRAFFETLRELGVVSPIVVCAFKERDSYDAIVEPMRASLIVATQGAYRPLPAGEVAGLFERIDTLVEPDPQRAYALARKQAGLDDTIVVVGSIYMIGGVLACSS